MTDQIGNAIGMGVTTVMGLQVMHAAADMMPSDDKKKKKKKQQHMLFAGRY